MQHFRARQPNEDMNTYLQAKQEFKQPQAVKQPAIQSPVVKPTQINPQDFYKINTGQVGKDEKPIYDILRADGQKVSPEEGLALFQGGLNVDHIKEQGQQPLDAQNAQQEGVKEETNITEPLADETPEVEPITSQYVRYGGSPDVFNSQTGEYISETEAEKIPDLFSKVQDVEAPRPDIQNEADFAKKAETNLQTYGADTTPSDFKENPLQAFENSYMQIYKNLGLPTIREEIDNITKQKTELENKRIEEVNAVNDNPWLSESMRSRKVNQVNDNFDSRSKNIINTLTLYDNLYQRGTQQAQFITKGALDAFQAQQTLDSTQLDRATQRAIQMAQLDLSRIKEVDGGLYDTQENRWLVPRKKADGGALPTSYREWELTGKRGSYADFIKKGGDGVAETGDIEKDTESIMSGTLNLQDISTAKNYRANVAKELTTKFKEARKSGDVIGSIRASAVYDKEPAETFITSMDKAMSVLTQVGVLQATFETGKYIDEKGKEKKLDFNPIVGLFRKVNPWDTQAQSIKAQLNAIVPNLARGIYGEVGVLTDNDIKLYSQTLPTLTSTEDVKNAVLFITTDIIRKNIENKIKNQMSAQRDMSGYEDIYNNVNTEASNILNKIPGAKQSAIPTQGGDAIFDNLFKQYGGK